MTKKCKKHLYERLSHNNIPFLALVEREITKVNAKLAKDFYDENLYFDSEDIKLFTGGKKLRSVLFILSARLNLSKNTRYYRGSKIISTAAAIELFHTASLIHDDIIDKSEERRGCITISLRKGDEIALLAGDMHFTGAIRLLVSSINDLRDIKLLKYFTEAMYNTCRGEMEDFLTKFLPDLKLLREQYFRNIRNKTAALIALSCEAGAIVAGADTKKMFAMKQYGNYLGLAFQVIDDILDFTGNKDVLNKSIMRDLMERRVSLPIIYALESLPKENIVRNILEGHIRDSNSIIEAAEVIIKSDGICRAYDDASLMTKKAISSLSIYPSNKYKKALEELALFVVKRQF
jgi:heptaprenyl diphosphate synthase